MNYKTNIFDLKSVGLYSSFCFYKPDGILFDCGEGAAEHFKNRVFAIKKIFLTHSHWDHVGGLIGLIGSRNVAMGTKFPLEIYYPEDSFGFDELIKFLKSRVDTDLCSFSPINQYREISLGDTNRRFLSTIKVKHSHGSLGYIVRESRKRLKKEFVGQDIKKLKENGISNSQLSETYIKNLFAYTLDSFSFNESEIFESDVWIADATFLNAEDRKNDTHMTWEEVSEIANRQKVKETVFAHLSSRYNLKDVKYSHHEGVSLNLKD